MRSARAELGEAAFEAALSEGRAMLPLQAADYALGAAEIPDVASPAASPEPRPSPSVQEAGETEGRSDVSPKLRIYALGGARVERDGVALAPSQDWIHKPRELLFYLLSYPAGRTREQVGLDLWPEASSSQLRSSFHDAAFRLRRALGDKGWIVFRKGRYSFGRSLPYSYDVEAFERSLSMARRARDEDPEQAIGHLREATVVYAGDFLEGGSYGEWAMVRQDELRREYGEALLLLGRLLSSAGRHAEAAEAFRGAVAHDGFMEEAHRGLMHAHVALGERGRALKQYEELERLLADRLGASPAPETTELYESLR
jgi:DNA-binding SARP family transcriptional activator